MELSAEKIAKMMDLSCVQASNTLDEIKLAAEAAKNIIVSVL